MVAPTKQADVAEPILEKIQLEILPALYVLALGYAAGLDKGRSALRIVTLVFRRYRLAQCGNIDKTTIQQVDRELLTLLPHTLSEALEAA